MKRILLIFVILIWFGSVWAQQEENVIGPKRGTVTASLLLGNSDSYNWSLTLPSANQNYYSISAPQSWSTPTSNSLVNMIGIEGKWFLTDKWAIRFNGSSMLDATPAHDAVPGVSASSPIATIPAYRSISGHASALVIANLGVDRYFATNNRHLYWYASPVVNFLYGRLSGFDVSDINTDTLLNSTVDPGTARYGELYGIGLSGVFGAEFYTESGIVFGFEMRGVSYMYTVNSILPVEGMKPLKADNHTISFLSLPTVKIGFRF